MSPQATRKERGMGAAEDAGVVNWIGGCEPVFGCRRS